MEEVTGDGVVGLELVGGETSAGSSSSVSFAVRED